MAGTRAELLAHGVTPGAIDQRVRRHFLEPVCRGVYVMLLNGLPVTGPARTVVDLAAMVGPNRLRHIIETQVRDDNPSADDLIACFERVARQGVPGSAELRRQLHLLFGDRPVTV